MKRYADTFFRSAIIALIPIVVLPVAAFLLVYSSPRTNVVAANVWVSAVGKQSAYSGFGPSQAQSLETNLKQLLPSTSFELLVARQSPQYWKTVATRPDRDNRLGQDFGKGVQVSVLGPSVVSVSMQNRSAKAALELLQALLRELPQEIHRLDRQQVAKSTAYYLKQSQLAQNGLSLAERALGNYLRSHNIASKDVSVQALFDPSLATLYQAVQAKQADVQNAQQQLQQIRAQSGAQTTFSILDPPAEQGAASRKKQLILDLVIAVAVSLALSGAFVVVRTALDRSMRFADDVTSLLGLPVLATVPYSEVLARKKRGGPRDGGDDTVLADPIELEKVG